MSDDTTLSLPGRNDKVVEDISPQNEASYSTEKEVNADFEREESAVFLSTEPKAETVTQVSEHEVKIDVVEAVILEETFSQEEKNNKVMNFEGLDKEKNGIFIKLFSLES